MEKELGKPQRAVGVRGNCFSFLLPWESVMQKLSRVFARGDFTTWPMDQETAAEVVRVRFVHGHEALRQQFKELQVRSSVVKGMANLYVDNHLHDLMQKDVVVKLLTSRSSDLRGDFRRHIAARVDAEYPPHLHGKNDGAIPERIRKAAEQTHDTGNAQTTAFDLKPATGHDEPADVVSDVLSNLRPSIARAPGDGRRCVGNSN